MQRMDIEPTFVLCWTVWEHLYSTINPKALSTKQLELLEGKQKITYFFVKYFGLKLNKGSHNELLRITKARNTLLHRGKKPSDVDYGEMTLFIQATACLISKILGLTPSNVFNTNEKLARFLKLA